MLSHNKNSITFNIKKLIVINTLKLMSISYSHLEIQIPIKRWKLNVFIQRQQTIRHPIIALENLQKIARDI